MIKVKRTRLYPNQQLLMRQLRQTCIPTMTKVWNMLYEENNAIFKYNTELNIITMTQVIMTYSTHGKLSYQNVCSEMGLNSVGSTICKKRKKIRGEFFKKLYWLTFKEISTIFNTKTNTKFDHIYAIDGSYLSCKTHNPKQPDAGLLLSLMYDVKNLIPIDFVLLPEYDERKAITNHHIKKIPQNTLILVDRGYFSNELLNVLSKRNISVTP
tara:strand:- start:695 stop:1330 length:636 start_codon:yes stop_codon:yes gene_type:complete